MPAALSARPTDLPPLTIAELIVVEETERGAVGARMHDGPVQDLLATRYLTDLALSAAAKGADADTLRARLESIREAAALALVGSRQLMADLNARGTDGLGLADALLASAESIAPAASVSIGGADDPELGQLPPAVAVTAYRLAGALLRACESPAPHLDVRRGGQTLTLTLDSAVCLDHPEVAGWVRRVTALGGTVQSGTDLRVDLPLDQTTTPVPEGQP